MAKLKIYTDENVDVRVSMGLRKRGIYAFSAIERGFIDKSDLTHFGYAIKLKAVIFTHDHHFIEIAKKMIEEKKEFWGLIFVEMNRLTIGESIKRLSLYAELLDRQEMKNRIEFL